MQEKKSEVSFRVKEGGAEKRKMKTPAEKEKFVAENYQEVESRYISPEESHK